MVLCRFSAIRVRSAPAIHVDVQNLLLCMHMLEQAITDFPKQFAFAPVIENLGLLPTTKKFLVAGMGGSNHATDVIRAWKPTLNIIVHRDYGLPELHDQTRLVVACSYSGNTEETIDAFVTARARNLHVAAIAKGGKLIELAKAAGVPYIVLPDTGIQPRSATGFMFVALMKLLGETADMEQLRSLEKALRPKTAKADGKLLAKQLKKFVPVVYASTRNAAVANNWKIKMNENAKIPCYTAVFPELNHNEMNGFDVSPKVWPLMKKFRFVFLIDSEDDARVQQRMLTLERLYRDRGFDVETVHLAGASRLERIFCSLLLADWTSLFLAKAYKVDPEPVRMVEDFKRLIGT